MFSVNLTAQSKKAVDTNERLDMQVIVSYGDAADRNDKPIQLIVELNKENGKGYYITDNLEFRISKNYLKLRDPIPFEIYSSRPIGDKGHYSIILIPSEDGQWKKGIYIVNLDVVRGKYRGSALIQIIIN